MKLALVFIIVVAIGKLLYKRGLGPRYNCPICRTILSDYNNDYRRCTNCNYREKK